MFSISTWLITIISLYILCLLCVRLFNNQTFDIAVVIGLYLRGAFPIINRVWSNLWKYIVFGSNISEIVYYSFIVVFSIVCIIQYCIIIRKLYGIYREFHYPRNNRD